MLLSIDGENMGVCCKGKKKNECIFWTCESSKEGKENAIDAHAFLLSMVNSQKVKMHVFVAGWKIKSLALWCSVRLEFVF